MAPSPMAIRAGMRLLGRLFPAPHLEQLTSEPFEKLHERYKSWDQWGNLVGFLAYVGLAAIYYFLLSWLAKLTTQRFENAKYLLRPVGFEYGIIGAILSVFSALVPICLALRAILGRREYNIYLAYGGRRVVGNFHIEKVAFFFFLVFFPALAVVGALRATTFTAFTEIAMFDSSFGCFGVLNEHRYRNVRNIYLAQGYHARFEDKVSPRFVIVFRDGFQRRTDSGSIGSKLEHEAAMVRYVSQQSVRPIVAVKFIENIPH